MKDRIAIILLVLIPVINTVAQNFSEDMKKVSQAYLQLKKFSNKIEVSVFSNGNYAKPSVVFNTYQAKSDLDYFVDVSDVQYLINARYAIIVNKKSKVIAYSPIPKNQPATMKQLLVSSLHIDSVIKGYDKVLYTDKGDQHLYTVFVPKNAIEKMEITVDKKTSLIKQVIYNYNRNIVGQDQRVIMKYNTDINPVLDENFFSEKRFFKLDKNKAIAVAEYKNYEVVLN